MEEFIKDKELNNLQNEVSRATVRLNNGSLEANKEYIISTERVGWFSAGAISLSFTLIGYLLTKSEFLLILKDQIFFVPIIGVLMIGWMALGLSVLASLLTRRLNASFLEYNNLFYWYSKNKELKQKMIECIDVGMPITFMDAENSEQAKENIQGSKKNYEDWEIISKKKKKLWLKFSNLCQAFVYTGVFVGIILLVLFLIIITFKITLL